MVYRYFSCILSSVLIYYFCCSCCRICSCVICRCHYKFIVCYGLRCSCICKSRLACSAHCGRCIKRSVCTLFYIFYYNVSYILSLVVVVDCLSSACEGSVCCRTYRYKVIIIDILLYRCKCASKLISSVKCLLSCKYRICSLLKIIYHYISCILSSVIIDYSLRCTSVCKSCSTCRTWCCS